MLNRPISMQYEWFKGGHLDELTDADDLDKDGLYDYQEILFRCSDEPLGEWLINIDDPYDIQLYTFEEIKRRAGENLFYIENGLKRYRNSTGDFTQSVESLNSARILPIKTDPTNPDGDGDGILDVDEIKWNGIDERYKTVNPLKRNTLESFYSELNDGVVWNGISVNITDNTITFNVSALFDPELEDYKEMIKNKISERWCNKYTGNLYDFYPGLEITVEFNWTTNFNWGRDSQIHFIYDGIICDLIKTSYHTNLNNSIYIYSEHLNPKSIGTVVSHEFGHALGLDDVHLYKSNPFNDIVKNIKYIPLACYVNNKDEIEIKLFNIDNNGEIMYYGTGAETYANVNNIEMALQQLSEISKGHVVSKKHYQKFVPYALGDVSKAIKQPFLYYNVEDDWIYYYDLKTFHAIPKLNVTSELMEKYKVILSNPLWGEKYLELIYSFQQFVNNSVGEECSIEDLHSYSGIQEAWSN